MTRLKLRFLYDVFGFWMCYYKESTHVAPAVGNLFRSSIILCLWNEHSSP